MKADRRRTKGENSSSISRLMIRDGTSGRGNRERESRRVSHKSQLVHQTHTQPWKWAAPGRQERNSLKGEGMADRLRFHNPGFAIQKGIRDTKESHEYEYGREEREAGGK